MRKIAFLLFFLPFVSFSQTTNNPPFSERTSSYVDIIYVQLTNNETIFYMSSYTETEDEYIKRYFKENPEMYRRLANASSMEQASFIKKLRQQFQQTDNTISLSPNSYLVDRNNRKYRFLRAEGIPISPDNLRPYPGKTYKFKAYYERVQPGMEVIDYIEDIRVRVGSMQYWNFHDIRIKNPARNEPAPQQKPVPDPQPPVSDGGYNGNVLEQSKPAKELRLYGKVYDDISKKPIQAKVVCKLTDYGVLYDSVTTSKSGYYEFLFKPASYTYEVSSPGYENQVLNVKLQELGSLTSFEKDIYLKPVAKLPEPKPEPVVVKEPNIGEKVETPAQQPETFRLSNVYFQKGRSNILETSYAQLDALANYLTKNPTITIRIEGHTDNAGDPALNQKLSVDRAFEVRQYLIEKGKISGERLKFIGYGDTRPVSPNDSEENKAKNRRVEYVILTN